MARLVPTASPEADAIAIRRRIAEAAQGYLDGSKGAVETSRTIASLARQIDSSLDDLLVGFTGIDSETDALPLGEPRALWSESALGREDAERQRYESDVASEFAAMCERVVAVFGHTPSNKSLERGRGG